jgi:UDP-N-acetylmuramate dehydrogenase
MINIKQNIPLKNYSTFRIGGPAKYFIEVSSEEELLEALNFAKDNNLKFFILGGGSNLLINDEGFSGLVIKIMLNSYFLIHDSSIECGSGVSLARIVNESVSAGLSGMEWAAGIPGTIGGAVRGNARAYGKNTGMAIESVRALDAQDMQIKTFSREECKFEYWGSIFKSNPNLIILSVVFKFEPGNKEDSQKITKETLANRIAAQPQGVGNPGSFFLNPLVSDEKLREEFERDRGTKCRGENLPAGWIIERAGLKGKKIGGAMVSEKHANFIVNTGSATAEDVIMLVSLIKQQVRDKFGIELQGEVQYLGF